MNRARKYLLLFLSIAAAGAAEKDKAKFKPGPISGYPSRQTVEKVTVAARAYVTEERAKEAFGKLNPYRHGLLPVLVLIENGTGQTLALDGLRVEYQTAGRQRAEAIPAAEVRYASGPNRPGVYTGPPGTSPRVSRRKNPLDAWEIEGRAFSARMLPAGETASGFFYFQAAHRGGASLYVTGLREAASGRELFYFEVPLEE